MTLHVNLGEHSYDIIIKQGILTHATPYIRSCFKGHKAIIISDDNVYPLYGAQLESALLAEGIHCASIILPHGEETKNIHGLPAIYGQLATHKITRSDLIIALGGGVIGDLAGFVASTYLRGIAFVQIPTSLLAQVDSSVGGKVAVDLEEGKNLVGSFYQPKLVIIDPLTLGTLPTRYLSDGMAEVIKYGCIKDASLFALLKSFSSFDDLCTSNADTLTHIIYRCVDIKRQVVEADQFDTGERMILNFGHTIGHALEQFFQYKRESHGEAVAIGMYQLTKLAEEKGLTKQGTADVILQLLNIYQLPYQANVTAPQLLEAILVDKKNLDGQLNLILLHEIGDSYIYPTNIEFFEGVDNL